MSIKQQIIDDFHCWDVHGEMCGDCKDCKKALSDALNEFETEIREKTIAEVYDVLYKEYYYGFRTESGTKQWQVDYIINGFFGKLKNMKKRHARMR